MAGENVIQINGSNSNLEAKEDDVLFMEIIREFPNVYNRASKDFKDRNMKLP